MKKVLLLLSACLLTGAVQLHATNTDDSEKAGPSEAHALRDVTWTTVANTPETSLFDWGKARKTACKTLNQVCIKINTGNEIILKKIMTLGPKCRCAAYSVILYALYSAYFAECNC